MAGRCADESGEHAMTACYLCGSEDFRKLPGKVRDMPELGILKCEACGLVCLDSFAHITTDYYSSAYTEQNHPEADWQRCINESLQDDTRRAGQLLPLISNKRYLDIGCGGGGVLLQVRDRCKSASGVEPQTSWRKHLQDAGVAMHAELGEVAARSKDVISLFHVLEHIADPIPFLHDVWTKLDGGGALIIEVPNAEDALLGLYGCKAFSEFTYWSPHLFLYSASTLQMLLKKAGLPAKSVVQQFQRYPLSNHLMWLSQGKPGGHQAWSHLDSPELHAAYAARLAALGCCDTLIATVQTA
jgi:2-polyprenyl-3-methyl-5-hydroxy-6-metoxy-1,4-benzoquinol methylase